MEVVEPLSVDSEPTAEELRLYMAWLAQDCEPVLQDHRENLQDEAHYQHELAVAHQRSEETRTRVNRLLAL